MRTLVLVSFLAHQSGAQPSADELSQRRTEQAAPRTAIAFDAKQFDKYVGYYQLTPTLIFNVTREGEHFYEQLTGQPAFEIFAESTSKFFLKVVAAQISFDTDAAGNVTGLVLHQNGRELAASRIDEAQAKRLEADRHPPGHPMPRNWPVLTNITPRFLTNATKGSDYWPCFSPDGNTVAFSRTTDGRGWQLLRVAVSGGTPEKLSQSPLPVAATRCNWSAKSDLIAFTGISAGGSSATWVINGNGTGAHALGAAGLSDQMFYPSWYPDGSRLVAMDGRNLVIKRMDLVGTAAVPITRRAEVLTGMPSVSPDGHYALFIIGRDGTGLTQVTDYALNANHPLWSADGRHMLFSAMPPGGGNTFGNAIIDLP